MNDNNTAQALGAINRRLIMLTQLFAYQIAEGKTLTEAVPILRRLGLPPSEIAAVFGSTAQTVSVRLAEAKKKRAKRKPR